MGVNKIVFGTETKMDISDSTVTPDTLQAGVVAYNADGDRIVGTGGNLKFENVSVMPEYFSWDDRLPMYPYRADIPLEGVTSGMFPIVAIAGDDGENGIFKPAAESYDGGVRLWAVCVSTEAITIDTIVCIKL